MRTRLAIYIGVGALVLLALACAGYFFLSQKHAKSVSPSSPAGAFTAAVDASTSTPASITSASAQPPPNTKEYQNNPYDFSLYYPDDLTVSEQKVGGNSEVLLFQDKTSGEGFDVFVTPYGEPKITQQRFEMDEPSGVMNDPQNITIDGAAATEFFSTNPAMGASREIWFLHEGYLYEVTAPQPLDQWLLQIMQTWHFT